MAVLAPACGRFGFDETASQSDARGTTATEDAAPSIDAEVSPYSATHNGWLHVRATGATTPKATPTPIPATPLSVEFSWAPPSVSPDAPIDSLKIFRATDPDGPYAFIDTIDGAATTYSDTSAQVNTTYYYRVRPSVEDFVLTPTQADATLEVPVPPENTALVHRWMANQEVCALLGQAPDRANDYRCTYTGPGRLGYDGNTGVDPDPALSFYDIGDHYHVDTFETGCDYTLESSGCPADDGSPGPCLGGGTGDPTSSDNAKSGNVQVGNEGDVFYVRGTSRCWYRDASGWVGPSQGATDTQMELMASNSPGLPPLVRIRQDFAREVCKLRSSTGVFRQLLTRKLHVASSAWPLGMDDAEVFDAEAGAIANSCNTNLGQATNFDDLHEPADYATLPATITSQTFTTRTGDPATRLCESRYGIHNLVGNVWEWTSDQWTASMSGVVITGIQSNLNPDNRDVQDVIFSRNTGTGGGEWRLDQAPALLPALGIPVDESVPEWFQPRSFASVDAHGDGMFMDQASDQTRGTYVGGSTSSAARAGRYAINVSRPPNESHERIGFRCTYPVLP